MTKNTLLNEAQEKAVKTINGRILVLAGAGSGKTRVITHRISYLINQHKVDPSSILGLTFTNKAAKEMQERVAKMIGSKKAKLVTLSTFHSFCLQILRKEAKKVGYTPNFSIYDERDMQRLITSLVKDIIKSEDDLPSLAPFLQVISDAKNKNLKEDEFPSLGDKEKDDMTKELYQRISQALMAYNAVDFDTILSLTVQLFEENPSVLEKYQDIYKFIMIDEYQDTNPIQYRLAELLSKKYNNLLVVGDDDQAIYSWRGSSIEHILNFETKCAIKLEQNYRSTPNILDAANAVIKNNKTRHNKNLWSTNPCGDKITLFHAPTELEEAQSVISRAISLKTKENLKWSDIAILYRSNSLSRNLEVNLIQAMWQKDKSWIRGIPYQICGGLEFAERSEIKDILAYLKIITNPSDHEALLRIINVPRRSVSDKTIKQLTDYIKLHKIALWTLLEKIADDKLDLSKENIVLQSRSIHGIKSFVEIIKEARIRFEKKPMHKALEWLIEKAEYKNAIKEEVKSEKMREYKLENVFECVNALAQYEEEMPSQEVSLAHFISSTILNRENLISKEKQGQDKLQLLTLHSAKGLEFKACFIIGLEDHILPHEKNSMETSVDEERRLFYVGITRAMKYLFLSMARNRRRSGKPTPTNPSRFLFEIPQDLLNVSSWKTFE